MAKKIYTYRGKTLEELKQMSTNEFAELLPAKLKRSLKRGLSHSQEMLLKKIKEGKKKLRTHARDLVVLPQMVGLKINVYRGDRFAEVYVEPEMIGHKLGELVMTRAKLQHSAPGIGATKSTTSISVR